MLLGRRAFRAAALDASLVERAVLHSGFQVFVKERRGLVCDDAIFGKMDPNEEDDASYLVVPLHGDVRLRAGERQHALRAGEFLTDLRGNPRGMRQVGNQTSLVLEWRPGTLGTRSTAHCVGRLSGRSLEGLRAAAAGLAAPDLDAGKACEGVRRIVSIFRAEGLPFDSVEAGDFVEEVPEPIVSLVQAMDLALNSLDRGPALSDLQTRLGCSRSGLHRRLIEFQERYGRGPSAGWREALHRYRLQVGLALMSAPGATTEGVSKLLGYASPKAFCYAFAKAGLPSPGSVNEALRRLD